MVRGQLQFVLPDDFWRYSCSKTKQLLPLLRCFHTSLSFLYLLKVILPLSGYQPVSDYDTGVELPSFQAVQHNKLKVETLVALLFMLLWLFLHQVHIHVKDVHVRMEEQLQMSHVQLYPAGPHYSPHYHVSSRFSKRDHR